MAGNTSLLYSAVCFLRVLWPRIRERVRWPILAMSLVLLIITSAIVFLMSQILFTTREVMTLKSSVGEVRNNQEWLKDRFKNLELTYFDWRQGQDSVRMIQREEGICYLTHVQGKFEGSGESVFIVESDGYWSLGGTSQQRGVSARAVCWTFPSALQTTDDAEGP